MCVRESVRDVKYVWTNICTPCMHWHFCQLSLCVRTCLVLHSLSFALVSLVDAHQTVCNCLRNFQLFSTLSISFFITFFSVLFVLLFFIGVFTQNRLYRWTIQHNISSIYMCIPRATKLMQTIVNEVRDWKI